MKSHALSAIVFGVLVSGTVFASDVNSLRTTIDEFSTSMREGGGGWQAYETFLHEDLSRWSTTQPVYTKEELMPGMREWWDGGNRQATRDATLIDVRVTGDLGFARFRLRETYVDPDGEQNGAFDGYVDHTWKFEEGRWKLIALNIFSLSEDAD